MHRLGFADAAVAAHEAMLADRLATFCDATTTIVVPWSADGHPDHEAVGRAGRVAAARAGAGMWETAIWANARRDFVAAHVLRLGDFATTKRHAVAAFASQINCLGDGPEDGPVLSAADVRALVGPYESIVCAS